MRLCETISSYMGLPFAEEVSGMRCLLRSAQAACLRALAQHEGRLDAAIDTLLSGDGNNP